MTQLQGSWIWYELMTTDATGAKAFYDRVVGWNISAQSDSPDMDYRMIANNDGGMTGGVFQLNQEMLDGGARPAWLGYIGVDNCDAAVTDITAKGGQVMMPAGDIAGAGRIAMVTDPDGAPFYVMTPHMPEGGGESTAFSETLLGRCGWNELMAGNAAAAQDFYTSMFNWTLPDAMDMGPMGKYQIIAHDGTTVGGIMQKMPEMPVACWNHYFLVASIEVAMAAVNQGGGKIINGPMQVPSGQWVINGIDPQGAMFSLVGGK
jgi:uncharacterized protein